MSCVHRHDAPRGLHADAPPFYPPPPGLHADAHPGLRLPGHHADAPPGLPGPRPAESTRDAINNIQREIETMNARLAELSLLLRDLLGRQQNAENVENADELGAAVRFAD